MLLLAFADGTVPGRPFGVLGYAFRLVAVGVWMLPGTEALEPEDVLRPNSACPGPIDKGKQVDVRSARRSGTRRKFLSHCSAQRTH